MGEARSFRVKFFVTRMVAGWVGKVARTVANFQSDHNRTDRYDDNQACQVTSERIQPGSLYDSIILIVTMSSTSTPISSDRFAEAIRALPLSNLHLKAAELHNSIVHLKSSNQQLKPSADDGDSVCSDAIQENLEVIRRMRDRILLLRQEVEQRGFPLEDEEKETKPGVNGHIEYDAHENSEQAGPDTRRDPSRQGGLLSGQEPALRLQERITEGDFRDSVADIDGGGIHL